MIKKTIKSRYVPFWHLDAEYNTPSAYFRWRQFLEEIISDVDFPLIATLEYSVTGIILEFNYLTPRISKMQSRIRSTYLRLYMSITGDPQPNFKYEYELNL